MMFYAARADLQSGYALGVGIGPVTLAGLTPLPTDLRRWGTVWVGRFLPVDELTTWTKAAGIQVTLHPSEGSGSAFDEPPHLAEPMVDAPTSDAGIRMQIGRDNEDHVGGWMKICPLHSASALWVQRVPEPSALAPARRGLMILVGTLLGAGVLQGVGVWLMSRSGWASRMRAPAGLGAG